jgi:hypothetical protein
MKKYVVFNQQVAGYLMFNKFQLKNINPSRVNPEKNVFVFNDSEDLRNAISQYNSFKESILSHL